MEEVNRIASLLLWHQRTDAFDVEVTGLGESVVRVTPLTAAGRHWIEEHVASESWQWLGGSLCIDHRYARDILGGLDRAGLRFTASQGGA